MGKLLCGLFLICVLISGCNLQSRPIVKLTPVGTQIPVEMPVLVESSLPATQITPPNEIVRASQIPANQALIISEIRHEDGLETIVVKNNGLEDFDASLYMLFSPELSLKFVLQKNLLLKSGEAVEVYNGEIKGLSPDYVWLPQMVLTKPGDTLILVAASGMIVYYFDYYPDSDSKKEK